MSILEKMIRGNEHALAEPEGSYSQNEIERLKKEIEIMKSALTNDVPRFVKVTDAF